MELTKYSNTTYKKELEANELPTSPSNEVDKPITEETVRKQFSQEDFNHASTFMMADIEKAGTTNQEKGLDSSSQERAMEEDQRSSSMPPDPKNASFSPIRPIRLRYQEVTSSIISSVSGLEPEDV